MYLAWPKRRETGMCNCAFFMEQTISFLDTIDKRYFQQDDLSSNFCIIIVWNRIIASHTRAIDEEFGERLYI